MTILSPGDIVTSVCEIGSSGGLMPPVPTGTQGVVTYIYPDGEMVSPFDGTDYRLKVKFPGHLNICRCLDGCHHVADAEVEKVEVTDRDIWDFFEGEGNEEDEDGNV